MARRKVHVHLQALVPVLYYELLTEVGGLQLEAGIGSRFVPSETEPCSLVVDSCCSGPEGLCISEPYVIYGGGQCDPDRGFIVLGGPFSSISCFFYDGIPGGTGSRSERGKEPSKVSSLSPSFRLSSAMMVVLELEMVQLVVKLEKVNGAMWMLIMMKLLLISRQQGNILVVEMCR